MHLRIEQMTVALCRGDILVLDPGEAHTFVSNSPACFRFVIHTPGPLTKPEERDNIVVSRGRLGL